MQSENKPFSPFGEIFYYLSLAKIKLKHSPFIFCGKDAIQEAKTVIASGQYALCLPYGKKVEDYKWYIDGLSILIYDTGGLSTIGLNKIAHAFSKEGVRQICVLAQQKIHPDIYNINKELYNVKGKDKNI